jgi:hypothetical protein
MPARMKKAETAGMRVIVGYPSAGTGFFGRMAKAIVGLPPDFL